jgi:nitrogen-specific signal transduction histidine kinase
MAIDQKVKTWNSYNGSVDNKSSVNPKTGDGAHETAGEPDMQLLMLQAQKNAEQAKEAAQGALNRFYEQSQISEKKAEKMVRELDDAIQNALMATQRNRGKNPGNVKLDKPEEKLPEAVLIDKKLKLSKKVLNSGPFNVVSGINKIFGNAEKELDPEVKAEFYQYVMRHSPQLRDLIDELTEDKARTKTEKILSETKAEILAARAAVNHAQEETNEIKEKARKAMTEAEATRRAAEQVVTQVKQSTIGQVAEEVSKAREEVKAVKAAAENAVRKAEEELVRVKAEAGAANNKATVAVTLAQEKVKKDAELLKNYKLQAKIAVKQAMDEANRLKEEAEAVRHASQEAVSKAALESQQARQTMELANKKLQESTSTAEHQAYEKFCEEIKAIRNETEATNKAAYEAITKSRKEAQQAREELAMVKKTHEAALLAAQQESAVARAEAKNAKQKAQDSLLIAQEETRKAKAEAEMAVQKASETMLKAKEEIISLTRGEISRARQDIESAGSRDVGENSRKSSEYDEPNLKLDSHRLATVLHEIRTPLHSISGFAKLMLEQDVADPATRKEFLMLMVQQCESLNRQVEDLSGILHNSFGLFAVEKEPVPAAQLISEAVSGMAGIAEQKKNLIHRNIPPSLPQIEVDVLRIKQVIANLITNAVKYSPERSNILVKAEAHEQELLVQVMDCGCGIPTAELPRIFDRFYRGTNHSGIPGIGLGLYISRQIVEAHGGRIWAESVEGQGSTFSFTLPLTAGDLLTGNKFSFNM